MNTSISHVVSGPPLAPLVRVRTFSPNDWEEFIQEWANSLKDEYHDVYRCGGAGDMGRDVVAHTASPNKGKPWDNYQCKHYGHPLQPNEIWVEIGKVIYYTLKGEYTIPRKYLFVAPMDVGTRLSRLLENPEALRAGLLENWKSKCQTGICSKEIRLGKSVKDHINSFPFEVFSFTPVLKVIEQHSLTPWHIHRFGGGLPSRPKSALTPDAIASNELKYTAELFRAYSDHAGNDVDESNLASLPRLKKHFLLSRASFYSAESLKAFSRDHLHRDEYPRLQNEIHDGILETYLDVHEDGYGKVVDVTKAAVNLPITDHALLSVLQPPDRRGICHQLVDMNRLRWVEDDA